jgi:hypothetical protein
LHNHLKRSSQSKSSDADGIIASYSRKLVTARMGGISWRC